MKEALLVGVVAQAQERYAILQVSPQLELAVVRRRASSLQERRGLQGKALVVEGPVVAGEEKDELVL